MHEAGKLQWNSRVQGDMIEYGWRSVCGFFFCILGRSVCGVLCSGLLIRPNHPGGIANI